MAKRGLHEVGEGEQKREEKEEWTGMRNVVCKNA